MFFFSFRILFWGTLGIFLLGVRILFWGTLGMVFGITGSTLLDLFDLLLWRTLAVSWSLFLFDFPSLSNVNFDFSNKCVPIIFLRSDPETLGNFRASFGLRLFALLLFLNLFLRFGF